LLPCVDRPIEAYNPLMSRTSLGWGLLCFVCCVGGVVLHLARSSVPLVPGGGAPAESESPTSAGLSNGRVGENGPSISLVEQGLPSAIALEDTLRSLHTQWPFPPLEPEQSDLATALVPWRALLDEAKRSAPVWVEQAQAVARMKDARVVLVADVHASPVPALAMAELMGLLASSTTENEENAVVLMEMVPRERQAQLDEATRLPDEERRSRLLVLLNECWPWPAEPIIRLIRIVLSNGGRIVGAGWGCSSSEYQRDVDDWRRQALTMERKRFAVGDTPIDRTDANIMATIQVLLKRERKPGVILVFVGAAHIMTPVTGLRARLGEIGVSPVVVVPYCPEAETWIRVEGGEEPSASRWLELAESCYRSPTMTREVIAKLRNTRYGYWERPGDK